MSQSNPRSLAEASLKQGDPEPALAYLQEAVRKQPADAESRTFLFQLLSLLGQWGRALTQLDVVADLDAGTLAMVQTYREALRCEVLRAEVFAGKRSPLLFAKPEPWVALMVEALRLTAEGEYAQADTLRGQAFEAAPATPGNIDGKGFSWVADADSRLGPMLEAIVDGRYYWIPFHHIRRIRCEEPEDLRDLVWTPAWFTWSNGGESPGLIPSRYPGSEGSTDPALLMGRRTEWNEPAPGLYLGLGQRELSTDVEDYALLDIRDIQLQPPAQSAEETESAGNQEPGSGPLPAGQASASTPSPAGNGPPHG